MEDERKRKRGTSEKKRVTKNCILENSRRRKQQRQTLTSKTLSKCSTFVFEDDDVVVVNDELFRFCRPRDLLAIIYFISI